MSAYIVPRPGTSRATIWAGWGVDRIRLLRPAPVDATFLRVMSKRCVIGSSMSVYLGDPDSLTGEQLATMAAWAAKRFDITPEEVRASMAKDGVPILANDEVVVLTEET